MFDHAPMEDDHSRCACGWEAGLDSNQAVSGWTWAEHYTSTLTPDSLRVMAARRTISELIEIFENLNHFHWRRTEWLRMHIAWGW
jgi:hypothetical protein